MNKSEKEKVTKLRPSFHPRVDTIFQEQIERRKKESWIKKKKERASSDALTKSGFHLPERERYKENKERVSNRKRNAKKK